MAFTKSDEAFIYQKVSISNTVDINGNSLAEIAEKFHDFSEQYQVDLDAITIDIEAVTGYYDDPATYEAFLVAWREPTEKEIEYRTEVILEQQKRRAETTRRQKKIEEDRERKEYARLHKKYGARAGVSAAE